MDSGSTDAGSIPVRGTKKIKESMTAVIGSFAFSNKAGISTMPLLYQVCFDYLQVNSEG